VAGGDGVDGLSSSIKVTNLYLHLIMIIIKLSNRLSTGKLAAGKEKAALTERKRRPYYAVIP
jgi:hypothetical protein